MKRATLILAAPAALAVLLSGISTPSARAELITFGMPYTVNNTNFPTTFVQNVIFDGTGVNKPIDGGLLQINDMTFATGPTSEWVAFNFSTETWVKFKVFGGIGLIVAFVLAQAAWLSRHIPDDPPKVGTPEP